MSTSSTTVSQSGCILVRKAGTFPPTELLTAILAANPTGWGASTVSDIDGTKVLESNGVAEACDLETLQDTLKAWPDQDITFYFCNSPTALSEKDMSPYVILARPDPEDTDEEELLVVAFIRGNFPANVKAGSSHPPEYHLVSDVLVPKLQGLYDMCDGDLDKLMLNLMKPHFKKDFLLNSVSEGTITLVAQNGVNITFQQDDEKKAVEGPWGWCSDGYGYGVKAEKPAEKPKKPGIFSGKSTVREKHQAQPSAAIAEAVKPPATDTKAIKGYTVQKWKPPTSLSRKETKNAYKMRIGYAPKGWQDGVEVDVFFGPDNKIMTFAQVKALGPISLGVQQLAKNPDRESDVQPDNVETQETLAATTDKKVNGEILPIMSPKTREAVNDVRNKDGYKKIIEEQAKVINDPKQFESYETKFTDFAQQLGLKSMEEFAHWDFEMIHNLNKSNPTAVEVMLNTFKNICLKNGMFKKETAASEVAAPPKKPGIFSRKSAAA